MSAATTENRKETAVMKTSNLSLQEMERKEGKKSTLKRWTSMGSNGNNNNNDNEHNFSVLKFPQIGKGLSFVVGDSWTAFIEGGNALYKVISVEDVIIPAGRYRCFKICEEMEGCKKSYYWFTPDVGLVKFDIAGIKGAFQGFSYEKML